jgi:hypothetical protein
LPLLGKIHPYEQKFPENGSKLYQNWENEQIRVKWGMQELRNFKTEALIGWYGVLCFPNFRKFQIFTKSIPIKQMYNHEIGTFFLFFEKFWEF